jgi:hypothetical protein|tara:strand:+ start:256 stop:516 length:261 start_codon:yes stop_codon:yes gene_type:complete
MRNKDDALYTAEDVETMIGLASELERNVNYILFTGNPHGDMDLLKDRIIKYLPSFRSQLVEHIRSLRENNKDLYGLDQLLNVKQGD